MGSPEHAYEVTSNADSARCRSFGKMCPPEQDWQRGQPLPLQPLTAEVCGKVVELLLDFMRTDHEAQVRGPPSESRICERG